jgi:sulfotransferase 6B1
MSLADTLKFALKIARWRLRRANARLKHGSLAGSPIFFANSFPKSGTHLLTQVLQGFAQIGPVVDGGLPAVLTYDGPSGQMRSLQDILRDLQRLRPGDISYGHLHALPQTVKMLTQAGVASCFIYRDPRDVVVSHVHYVTEMEPNHVHHSYYRHELKSFDERLRVSIQGRPELETPFPDIRQRFDPYLGWLERPEVLALQFEDFITDQDKTLSRILEHARGRGLRLDVREQEALQGLKSAIDPRRSPTFRSGKVGKWRETFSEEHKNLFKEICGDLLVRLGYEQSQDW